MIKRIMSVVAAFLLVAGVSAGSAYLAFEASPDPIILSETIEKPIEVVVQKTVEVEKIVEKEHTYENFYYVAIFEGPADPKGEPTFYGQQVNKTDQLPAGALYLLRIDYDNDPNNVYMGVTFGLLMPDGVEPKEITLFFANATNVHVTYIAGWAIPDPSEAEDEF